MTHDHGPHDCVAIADLDRIAYLAENFRCSLASAARLNAMCRDLSRQQADGKLGMPFGKAMELGVCAAWRRGEEWAADWLRGVYAPELGELWHDGLMEVLVQSAEVDGIPELAAQAHLGLLSP